VGDAALVERGRSSRRVALDRAARTPLRTRFQRPPDERDAASWGARVDSLATPPDVTDPEEPAGRDRGVAAGARRAAAHHPDRYRGDAPLAPVLALAD